MPARAQFVFGTCAAGAVVLTVNVVLLGGNIGFFQSMCLLGYCLFPMDLAAIVTACTTNMIARWIVVLVGCCLPRRSVTAAFPKWLLAAADGVQPSVVSLACARMHMSACPQGCACHACAVHVSSMHGPRGVACACGCTLTPGGAAGSKTAVLQWRMSPR